MRYMSVIADEDGLYSVLLPPMTVDELASLLAVDRCIWLIDHQVDVAASIAPIVSRALLNREIADIRCRVSRIEVDISMRSVDFLSYLRTTGIQGCDFVQSGKHQPAGMHFRAIPRRQWPSIIESNAIDFVFHTPADSEPALFTSTNESLLDELIARYKQNA